VNVTLIFSQDRYEEVMDAYLSGLEQRAAAGEPLDKVTSVASFFVSRLDTNVDGKLKAKVEAGEVSKEKAEALYGKAAVANAKLAYQRFRKVFESERFASLKDKGAQLQRPLWASTSTKNPDYPDVLYVDTLIGPNTVNTVPPNTLVQFNDHGEVALTLEGGLADAEKVFSDLEAHGVSIDVVTQELEEAGVKAFSDAFRSLIGTVETRRQAEL
jgi:transaldolase